MVIRIETLACIVFAAVASPALLPTASAGNGRPNIVLIMADDLGLGDLSHHVRTFMHKEPLYETPAIDALARQGLWFTDGHSATSLCSPTRYCMMSGKCNYRSNAPWGVWGTFRPSAIKAGEPTLGTVTRDAGYTTGFIGKWHLGGDFLDKQTGRIYRGDDNNDPDCGADLTRFEGNGPRACGFDYDFTLPCGVQGPIYLAYENEAWHPLGKDSRIIFLNEETAIDPRIVSDKGNGMGDSNWDTRLIGQLVSQKAVDFIAQAATAKKPFFLYYCSPEVHVPHCPPDEFDGKAIKGATPSRHLDMVLDLDQQVRRIVDALKAAGVYDNTLILFTSDNGGLRVDKDTAKAGHDSAGGWTGSKNLPEEGGHRVPFFAVWAGHIKPGTTDEPAISQDMLATLAAVAGNPLATEHLPDSNNLMPLLTGKGGYKPRTMLVQQAGSKTEVMFRKGSWKLIIQSNHACTLWEPIALYNLADDPQEKRNFAGNPEYGERIERMKAEYLAIRQEGRRTAP